MYTRHDTSADLTYTSTPQEQQPTPPAELEWDWDVEHEDRNREAKADAALHGARLFDVDRRMLKDIVREKMGKDVVRIAFISSGTFHKAYLITLIDRSELVARVARRFMPRLKTESEVATMHYLRENTAVPVPSVFHYEANPYNRLGGEYILMSKAPGIPLSKVYHSLAHDDLIRLLDNIAALLIPLFAHRFSHLGSLYFGPRPSAELNSSSNAPTPTAMNLTFSGFPLPPTPSMISIETPRPQFFKPPAPTLAPAPAPAPASEYHVGPIISWPFFGSNRGELDIARGPWRSTHSYLRACAEREIAGVVLENEGKAAPHRLHLDPDEVQASRHHHLTAVPGDRSDESDEWELEESEEEWDGPGDRMYSDYRRMQRSTFLVAHMVRREEEVRRETERWVRLMERLAEGVGVGAESGGKEEFGLDCHDLSLENVFVDEHDHSKITCVIDWESTTTRPLWACAHLPAFLESSPFTADLFRASVRKMTAAVAAHPGRPSVKRTPTARNVKPLAISRTHSHSQGADLAALAREWLHFEEAGARLRMAHRFAEWDGWEEGLADGILGPEEQEEEWFRGFGGVANDSVYGSGNENGNGVADSNWNGIGIKDGSRESPWGSDEEDSAVLMASLKRRKAEGTSGPGPGFAKEKERERVLDTTGDVCGGRGGELGRRLEAWLTVGGSRGRGWADESEYEAEAE